MNTLKHKKIGVWGYGVVGKSALAFLQKCKAWPITIFDSKGIHEQTAHLLQQQGIIVYNQNQWSCFLENDIIIPSPGIDLRPYASYRHKWIGEFDIFHAHWHKPIIAVTGTVGKTTIVHLLSQLLSLSGKTVATGGNIGTAMLDLIASQNKSDVALLELSSFQLDLCTTAKADLAIITNIYPNHLDRHGSFNDYCQAKYTLATRQGPQQMVLAPLDLAPQILSMKQAKNCAFFTSDISHHTLTSLPADVPIYYVKKTCQTMYKHHHKNSIPLLEHSIPTSSYAINWLIVCAALDMLGISTKIISSQTANQLLLPDHRLAQFACYESITFYNDSKATVPEATLAAVHKLKNAPIILFLGGISKGIDRTPFIARLREYPIQHILCFGKEATTLYAACIHNQFNASIHETLEEAVTYCLHHIAGPQDQILFSPSGASYDCFINYEERGNRFVDLVHTFYKR